MDENLHQQEHNLIQEKEGSLRLDNLMDFERYWICLKHELIEVHNLKMVVDVVESYMHHFDYHEIDVDEDGTCICGDDDHIKSDQNELDVIEVFDMVDVSKESCYVSNNDGFQERKHEFESVHEQVVLTQKEEQTLEILLKETINVSIFYNVNASLEKPVFQSYYKSANDKDSKISSKSITQLVELAQQYYRIKQIKLVQLHEKLASLHQLPEISKLPLSPIATTISTICSLLLSLFIPSSAQPYSKIHNRNSSTSSISFPSTPTTPWPTNFNFQHHHNHNLNSHRTSNKSIVHNYLIQLITLRHQIHNLRLTQEIPDSELIKVAYTTLHQFELNWQRWSKQMLESRFQLGFRCGWIVFVDFDEFVDCVWRVCCSDCHDEDYYCGLNNEFKMKDHCDDEFVSSSSPSSSPYRADEWLVALYFVFWVVVFGVGCTVAGFLLQ
ncbi:unnamed protein product [Ambrosiozyma monospora]|uniref:Unnamed protein product n=1 Tax=Ambrosiozyma monospora TaxID=43982 RepID=A0ACB5TC04_AMBMO|nr:unnamed protein product [Ambrosiozyma monospora]